MNDTQVVYILSLSWLNSEGHVADSNRFETKVKEGLNWRLKLRGSLNDLNLTRKLRKKVQCAPNFHWAYISANVLLNPTLKVIGL